MAYEFKGVKHHVLENAQYYMDRGRPGYRITSDYSDARDHPIYGVVRAHPAIDLTGAYGWNALDWVVSPWDGKIVAIERNVTLSVAAGDDKDLIQELKVTSGNYVRIRHNAHVETRLIHLKHGTVTDKQVGDIVKKGERLGYMGATGTATGAHLHLEVIVDGKYVDPKPYLLGEIQVVSDYDESGGENYMGYIKLTKELKYGDRGKDVEALQWRLCQLSEEINEEMRSHSMKKDGTFDGGFGNGTANTLKKVQGMAGLEQTGKLDKATMDFLNSDFITLFRSQGKQDEIDSLKAIVNDLEREKVNMESLNSRLQSELESLNGQIISAKNAFKTIKDLFEV